MKFIDLGKIHTSIREGKFIFVAFKATRQADRSVPVSIDKNHLSGTESSINPNQSLLTFLVNMWVNKSFANDEGSFEEVREIETWFANFTESLREIFDVSSLELRFVRKDFNFDIIIDDKEKFNFNNLSDGYSAIISILSGLIMQMEAKGIKDYNMPGLVLIDEIETHLHVDLQKKILPFFTRFFPNIQFIVTTHSPFVLSSLSNATICDLEKRIITSDLSNYSYDAILESYFDSDKYSETLKKKLEIYEELVSILNPTPEQIYKLRLLKEYFEYAPKFLAKELYGKLQQIELDALTRNR